VALLPAEWSGVLRVASGTRIVVSLDKAILENVWREHAAVVTSRPDLVATFDARDVLIEEICELLDGELAKPQLGSKLVFEGVAIALAAHLIRSYSGTDLYLRGPKGLTSKARERVLKVLGSDISAVSSVGEMADIAGLSQFHFIRQFKISFGVTPMQFLENERMRRAKAMIQGGKLSMLQIDVADCDEVGLL
jgi:AraC family transcriptional regulator